MITDHQLTSLEQVHDIYKLAMNSRVHEIRQLIIDKNYSVERLLDALIEFPDAFDPAAYKKMRDLLEHTPYVKQTTFPPYSLFNLVKAGHVISHPHLQDDGTWTGSPKDFVMWINNIAIEHLTDINSGADAFKILKAHNIKLGKTQFYNWWEKKFN